MPLVTVGGSVWEDHSGFLSPRHWGCDLGKMVVVPSPLEHLTSTRNLGVDPRFRLLHSVRKTAFFFSGLVKITTSSLISKCHITFLLGHSVKGYPCFASHSYPQKYGRKKIMSLKNFVSMTDHFNFILLADVVFFFFVGLSNHNVP